MHGGGQEERRLFDTLTSEIHMQRIRLIMFCGLTSTALCLSAVGQADQTLSQAPDLLPLETFILQPISIDCIGVWVPADRDGPIINRSCTARRNGVYSSNLSASVHHTRTQDCPDALARLPAEYAALLHEQHLPLTIFNGWQWECSYSLSQFESALYELDARGGSWEIALEAVLTRTLGRVAGEWIPIPHEEGLSGDVRTDHVRSRIEVITFDSLRTRDGYPKIRQLQ
jgi:hypothetical protein